MNKKEYNNLYFFLLLFCFAFFYTNNLFALSSKPNIILIIIDTVRSDHLSYMGYQFKTSPFMDSLATNGTIFPMSFSSGSWTYETAASFYSGLSVGTHGCSNINYDIKDLDSRYIESIPIFFPTLGEAFKNDGYETALFYFGGPRAFYSNNQGFSRGFNYIESDVYQFDESKYSGLDPFYECPFYTDNVDEQILQKAIKWINHNPKSRPLFVVIHLAAGHDPYERPEPLCFSFIPKVELNSLRLFIKKEIGDVTSNLIGAFGRPYLAKFPQLKKYLISQYDAGILSTDQKLSNFFDNININISNTIFSIISDHGEGLVEHKESYQHGDYNAPYSENFGVPTIFYGKNVERGKKIDNAAFSSIDLMPTLLGLANIKILPHLMGNNYSKHILGKDNSNFVFSNKGSFMESRDCFKVWGYFKNGWKYFTPLNSFEWSHGFKYSFSPESLFNLNEDKEEKNNLIFLHPEIARDYRNEIEKKLLWKRRGWNIIVQGDKNIHDYKIWINVKKFKIDLLNINSNLTLHYFSERNPFDIKTVLSNSFCVPSNRETELVKVKNSIYSADLEFEKILEKDQSYLFGAWIYSNDESQISINLTNNNDELISSSAYRIPEKAWTLVWQRFFSNEGETFKKASKNKNWKISFNSFQKGIKINKPFFTKSNDWIKANSINKDSLEIKFTMSEGFMVLNFRTIELDDYPNIIIEVDGKKVHDKNIYKGQLQISNKFNSINDFIYRDLNKDINIFRNGSINVYIYNIIDILLSKAGIKKHGLSIEDVKYLKTLGYIK